jgi:uncharacterized protein YbbK (DUF523 family)
MKVLVSACLLGRNCKYNGGNNRNQSVLDFLRGHEIIAVCPEVAAGLGVPRTPVEIVNGTVRDRFGNSYDPQLRAAVAQILEDIRALDIDCAVLQSRSPTCGVNQIYDGTFTGTRTEGSGILAQALKDAGYRVIDAEDIHNFTIPKD